jgi:hypothetical protein
MEGVKPTFTTSTIIMIGESLERQVDSFWIFLELSGRLGIVVLPPFKVASPLGESFDARTGINQFHGK